MKSVVVTSSLPDIVYFWADEEFRSHLNRVFLRDEVISQDDDPTNVDLNAALQYFSPLILSQRCMKRENCGYQSITLGNGIIIVIDQVFKLNNSVISVIPCKRKLEMVLLKGIKNFKGDCYSSVLASFSKSGFYAVLAGFNEC